MKVLEGRQISMRRPSQIILVVVILCCMLAACAEALTLASWPADYSTTQGSNGWWYRRAAGGQYSPVCSDYMLELASDGGWSYGPDLIWNGGGVTTVGQWTNLRWHSSVNSYIRVSGDLAKNPNGGDGVTVYIQINGITKWSTHIEPGDANRYVFDILVPVVVNDNVDFLVDPGATNDCDNFDFNVAIQKAVGPNTVASWPIDYSLTQGSNGWWYRRAVGGQYSPVCTDYTLQLAGDGGWAYGLDLLWNGGGVTTVGQWTNLRWHSSVNSDVRISGDLTKLGMGGDGITAYLQINGITKWSAQIGPQDGNGYAFDIPVSVAVNDNVDFLVNPGATNDCDNFGLNAQIDQISGSVSFDAEGICQIDGVPFFPICIYHADSYIDAVNLENIEHNEPTISYQDMYAHIAAKGFNTVAVWDWSETPFLDIASAYGLKVIRSADVDGQELDSLIFRYRDHPALLAWGTYDEPASTEAINIGAARYQELHSGLDLRHPVHVTQWAWDWLDQTASICDVLAPDSYYLNKDHWWLQQPWWEPDWTSPTRMVTMGMDHARQAVGNGRPLWSVIQAFGDAANFDEPNLLQLRNMVYQSVVAGARGISFYTYTGPERTASDRYWWIERSPLWDYVGSVVSELNSLQPVLLAPGGVTLPVNGVPDLKVLKRVVGSKAYVFAVNIGDYSQNMVLTGLGSYGMADVVGESRTIQVSNGTLQDSFAPLAVHVYIMDIDTTVPTAGMVTPPASVTTSTISLPYSGASDSPAGLNKVELWYKKESGGTWTNSGLTKTAGSDTFTFTPSSGSGRYYFDLVAQDNAGNRSAVASGSGDGVSVFKQWWSDGFESGNFTTGGWTNSGCTVSSTYKYSGTYSAEFNSTDSLTKSYSTTGKTDIKVEYASYGRTCPTSGHFIVDWSTNGTSWTTLENVTGVTSWGWVVKQWQLPSGANGKSGFRIRFRVTGYSSSQYAYLDDVKIIGL